MNFKDLEDAVSGETILCNGESPFYEVMFVGFLNGQLLTTFANDYTRVSSIRHSEADIKTWTIKEPKSTIFGPYYRYEYLTDGVIYTSSYVTDKFIQTYGTKYTDLASAKWKRKIGDPIYICDGIPCDIDGYTLY